MGEGEVLVLGTGRGGHFSLFSFRSYYLTDHQHTFSYILADLITSICIFIAAGYFLFDCSKLSYTLQGLWIVSVEMLLDALC